MGKSHRVDADHIGHSAGSRLLGGWRGQREAKDVAEKLELDSASYSRFENGVRRPSAEVMFRIEEVTDGAVPAKSWLDMERKAKAS